MGRILKAHQIRIDTEHPVFISNNKTTEAPAEKELTQNMMTGLLMRCSKLCRLND